MLLSHQLLRELNEIRLGGESHALATAIFTSCNFQFTPCGQNKVYGNRCIDYRALSEKKLEQKSFQRPAVYGHPGVEFTGSTGWPAGRGEDTFRRWRNEYHPKNSREAVQ